MKIWIKILVYIISLDCKWWRNYGVWGWVCMFGTLFYKKKWSFPAVSNRFRFNKVFLLRGMLFLFVCNKFRPHRLETFTIYTLCFFLILINKKVYASKSKWEISRERERERDKTMVLYLSVQLSVHHIQKKNVCGACNVRWI